MKSIKYLLYVGLFSTIILSSCRRKCPEPTVPTTAEIEAALPKYRIEFKETSGNGAFYWNMAVLVGDCSCDYRLFGEGVAYKRFDVIADRGEVMPNTQLESIRTADLSVEYTFVNLTDEVAGSFSVKVFRESELVYEEDVQVIPSGSDASTSAVIKFRPDDIIKN